MVNKLREFPVGIIEDLRSYVYLYVDPRDDSIFYIGKGQGDRVFEHLNEADNPLKKSNKVERIREIWSSGEEVIIRIHRCELTKEEASHVEASLIQLFPDTANAVEGLGTGDFGDRLVEDLINERQREPAIIDFPAVLINIRKAWLEIRPHLSEPVNADRLYNATRTAWKVHPSRHPSVKYAISNAFGIIRQVYRIEEWLPADVDSDGLARVEDGRWMFEGSIAADKQHLVGKAVDHLQKQGAQNPIKWLDKP